VDSWPRRWAIARALGVLLAMGVVFTACSPASGSSSDPFPGSLLSSSACAVNEAAGPITYVSPFGYDASAGIIDVLAARKLGYFRQMCLNTAFIMNSEDSAALVSAGTATTTSTGSAADFLVAVADGSNIVGVATYGDVSDYCIITRKNITSLKGLEGHNLGFHFVQEAPDLEMLSAAGVDTQKIQMVDTPDYDPNQIIQGKLDAVDCYQSNEPLTLKAEGAEFNEFTPSEYGVSGTYNVQFFNAKFLKDHYAAATDWMRADLHAFAYCEVHQAQCVSIEQQYASDAGSDFVVSHEDEVWQLESALSENHTLPGEGIGVESFAEWQAEAHEVAKFHLVKTVPALPSCENVTMVASLYRGTSLIWP
jgi:ABC-type nitrate/sulfonate/bicarbonate transport system substrate-binding protein